MVSMAGTEDLRWGGGGGAGARGHLSLKSPYNINVIDSM